MAATFELRVITADRGSTTREILDAFGRRNPGLVSSEDPVALTERKTNGIYVAIGPGALQAALNVDLNGPLLSTFTSKDTYNRLLKVAPQRTRPFVTAIFAEASPINQMTLIRGLYQRRVSVGVLLSESTADQDADLRRSARRSNLDLDVQLVPADENIIRALRRVGADTVLLAIPDRALYSVSNLRGVLESTYRRSQAVIGFTASLVNAGMLAAAYSSIDDIIAQIGDVIASINAGHAHEPVYPVFWRTAINDNVARSLNIIVTEDVRAMGNFPP